MVDEHVGKSAPGEDVPELDAAPSERPTESSSEARELPESVIVRVQKTEATAGLGE